MGYRIRDAVSEYLGSEKPEAAVFAGLVKDAVRYEAEHPGAKATVNVVTIVYGSGITPPFKCLVLHPEVRAADRKTIVHSMYVVLPSGRIASVRQDPLGRMVTGTVDPDESRDYARSLLAFAKSNLDFFGGDYEAYNRWAAWPQVDSGKPASGAGFGDPRPEHSMPVEVGDHESEAIAPTRLASLGALAARPNGSFDAQAYNIEFVGFRVKPTGPEEIIDFVSPEGLESRGVSMGTVNGETFVATSDRKIFILDSRSLQVKQRLFDTSPRHLKVINNFLKALDAQKAAAK
jgi:hypothetical protein